MPTLTEKLKKENDALKKQVKASSDKISEIEAKYQDKISEIEGKYQDLISKLESTKDIVSTPASTSDTDSSSSCCNNNATVTEILKIAKSTADDIKNFKNSFADVKSSVQMLKTRMGEFAQYSRINSLLFHGLKNVPSNVHGYDFAHYIVDAVNRLLGRFLYYQVEVADLEYAHILPTRSGKATKSVVLVKFRNRFAKYDIYNNRKNLKGSGVSVTEHLTAANLQLLSDTRAAVGFVNVWTSQTKILANFDGDIMHIKDANDLKNLHEKCLLKYPDGLPENYRAPRKESTNH